MQKTVLFLCTGNYYRSRFAEIFFNSVAGKMGLPWRATSRGLALERGVNNVGPIAAEVTKALQALGIVATEAVSRLPLPAGADDLAGANRIVALHRGEHEPLLAHRLPAGANPVEYWQVDDDPHALAHIEREVMSLVARILGGGGPAPPSVADALAAAPEAPKKPLTAKVGRETAGRRGKGVTTVFDLPLDDGGVRDLAAKLKQRCGTGGTVRDGRIEIQGDMRERVVAELQKLGFKVKRVGG